MVTMTQHKNGQGAEALPSGLIAEASGRKNGPRARMTAEAMPADIKVVPAVKARKLDAGPSEGVAKALVDEGDPARMLAELREVLFGPTRKLQEARLEELVVILEQLDSEARSNAKRVAEQFAKVENTDRKLGAEIHATNNVIEELKKQHERELSDANIKIHALSERLRQEMLRTAETQQRDMAAQADTFSAKLDNLAAKLQQLISEVSDHHKLAAEAMSADFSNQIRELSLITKATDDKIRMEIDTRAAQLAANAEEDKRRNLKILTEGLSGLSERLQTL